MTLRDKDSSSSDPSSALPAAARGADQVQDSMEAAEYPNQAGRDAVERSVLNLPSSPDPAAAPDAGAPRDHGLTAAEIAIGEQVRAWMAEAEVRRATESPMDRRSDLLTWIMWECKLQGWMLRNRSVEEWLQVVEKELAMPDTLNDPNTIWYGPHACEVCGVTIIKAAAEQGGEAFEPPARLLQIFYRGSESGNIELAYPMRWTPHVHLLEDQRPPQTPSNSSPS